MSGVAREAWPRQRAGAPPPDWYEAPEPPERPLPLGGRPTEALSGLGLAAALYGFLTQAGVPPVWAAIAGVAIGCVPTAISEIVDAIYGRGT